MKSVLTFAILALFFIACDRDNDPPPLEGAQVGVDVLKQHSEEFQREVITVTEGVHVAVGFGLANSILIEGERGNIVVDTMGSLESAGQVREAFRQISDRPIAAVIYTHYHPDHTLGASAFVEEGTRVIAHADTGPAITKLVTVVRPIITARSMRMFGNYLGDASVFNNGIGPWLDIGPDREFGIVPPTESFTGATELTIEGVRIELVHAPGETDDQIFVWLPERRVLLPGDNFYKSFPNLYTIRGTPYRDVMKWVASLDAMRQRSPEHLVPSHTRPISGSQDVEHALRDYRDAIQFVHDQTIRWMNKGLPPVEITRRVKLPEHLATSPYLPELYGRVDWSVRSVFNGYLGYFDGNPTNLAPATAAETAPHIAKLAGGWDALRAAAQQAVDEGDDQWALQLTDYLLAHDGSDNVARNTRIEALTNLGTAQANPNARHYYLTRALELRDEFVAGFDSPPTASAVGQLPVESFVRSLPVHLNAEEARDTEISVVFRFPDVEQQFTVDVRRGVAIVRNETIPSPDVDVEMNSLEFKRMLAGVSSPAGTLLTGDLTLRTGGRSDLAAFLALFRP